MATFELIDNPPRPVGGTGEVLTEAGGSQVILKWAAGKIVGIETVADSDIMVDMVLKSETSFAPLCYKCVWDGDQLLGCWVVPC